MFDIGTKQEKEDMEKQKYKFEEYEEMPEKEMLSMEKEMLGIYISGHPLEKMREQIMHSTNINSLDLSKIAEQADTTNIEENTQQIQTTKPKFVDGQKVKYAGIITSIKKKYTKNNKIMAFITIEDLYGTAEIIAFENAVVNAGKSLIEENIVVVDGRLSIRDDQEPTIIANEIKDLGEKSWIITFIYSILIIVLGGYFIVNPLSGATTVTSFIGIILCIYAVLDIIDCVIIKVKVKNFKKDLDKIENNVVDEQ